MTSRVRLVMVAALLAATFFSCGGDDSTAQSGPTGPEMLPNQVNIVAMNLKAPSNISVSFDQPIVMNSEIANGVQVANAEEVTAGANIVSNQVSIYATGFGTVDVLVLAVIQVDSNTITGTATVGDATVMIENGPNTVQLSNGPFSVPAL